MLKIYKNHLFEMVKEAGLDPTIFQVEEPPSGAFILRFKDYRQLIFSVKPKGEPNNFTINYVDFDPPSFNLRERYARFPGLLHCFNEWLPQVKLAIEEINEPDLWGSLSSVSSQNVSVFTRQQKTELKISLTKFKKSITKEFHPTRLQLKELTEKLDHLEESLDKLNQFDWSGVAINTLISISITLSLDSTQGHLLFELFKQAVGSIVRLLH